MPANHADNPKNCMARRSSDIIRGVIKKLSFSNFVCFVCSILAFFSVMLVHMCIIYVDNISHFELSVFIF